MKIKKLCVFLYVLNIIRKKKNKKKKHRQKERKITVFIIFHYYLIRFKRYLSSNITFKHKNNKNIIISRQ